MELIDQHTKHIMEGCKERARQAGLQFEDESLEYIVTNRDLLELSPKGMIPTLYDYWVHDVEVMKEKGKYELYPHNPYETVINTRPAISFYNDNNPDWLNVMIFYHVLAHIDFFQNNLFFRHTWDYDFTGKALSDKRMVAQLRSEKGRWVDYVIEFARGIDNLVGYHSTLSRIHRAAPSNGSSRLDFYFDVFLQEVKKVRISDYIQEIERYNQSLRDHGDLGEKSFFVQIEQTHPEFEVLFEKSRGKSPEVRPDLYQFLLRNAVPLNREGNRWMKSILEMIRNTSLFFQPQIRTKIMNEGWASYWHETLFLDDDRIRGHEIDFARVNASVTSLPRVGLNPYALGMRLFYDIEEMADRGKLSLEFQRLQDTEERRAFNSEADTGRATIFKIRENYCDFMFLSSFLNQDFVDRHRLFVAGKRMNKAKMTWEYFVKSRNAGQYRRMVMDGLYHPPCIVVDEEKSKNGGLYLRHVFEGKPLVAEYIANTMMGIEYFWGGPVMLETREVVTRPPANGGVFVVGPSGTAIEGTAADRIHWQWVLYTMDKRKLSKKPLA